jgi:GPN-loop GTPase
VNIGYFLGPAGSGKSHMTASLFEWMNNSEFDVITVNLDPAVVRLPYYPSVDVREFVSYEEIVDKYQLGPNGGIVAAMDQVAIHMDEIIDEINEFGAEYVIMDLPGQMEAFAFRSSGPVIMNQLRHENNLGGIFLIDPVLCNSASSFISILLFGVSISYRLNTSSKFMISKADVVSEERIDRISEWVLNPSFLKTDLLEESNVLNSDLSQKIADIIILAEELNEFPNVSSQTNQNIDLAFAEFQRIWGSSDIFN